MRLCVCVKRRRFNGIGSWYVCGLPYAYIFYTYEYVGKEAGYFWFGWAQRIHMVIPNRFPFGFKLIAIFRLNVEWIQQKSRLSHIAWKLVHFCINFYREFFFGIMHKRLVVFYLFISVNFAYHRNCCMCVVLPVFTV